MGIIIRFKMTTVPQTTKSAFYNSFLGETKSKFDFGRHKRSTSIQETAFFNWSNSNMYRTSYNEMANRYKSVERKNHVLPGYQGYRPKIAADSHLQKTFTEQSRDVFQKSKRDDPIQTMSATGFNATLVPSNEGCGLYLKTNDPTLNATSRRYGTRTEPLTHPNNHSKYAPNETTFRASYINPKRHPSSVYRDRGERIF